MKNTLILLLGIFLSHNSFAQVTTYERFFFDDGSIQEFLDIEALPNGGYIAAGFEVNGDTNQDFFVARVDADGNEVWKNTYGSDRNERFIDLTLTSEYIIIGGNQSSENFATYDVFMVVIDLMGAEVSEILIEGDGEDELRSVAGLSDGNFVAAYVFENEQPAGADAYLRKYAPDGTFLAETSIGTDNLDEFDLVFEALPSDDIIVTGPSSIRSYSNDLATLNWELDASDFPVDKFYLNFLTAFPIDANTYAFPSADFVYGSSDLVYVDITTGVFEDFITDFSVEAGLNMTISGVLNDVAYLGVNGADGPYILPFDIADQSFQSPINLTASYNRFTVTDEALVLAGSDDTNDYSVGKILELKAPSLSFNWETEIGSFEQEKIFFGYGIGEGEDGELYLSGVDRVENEDGVKVQKVSNNGFVIWETDFDLTNETKRVFSLTVDPNGGCVVPYYFIDASTNTWKMKIQKVTADGNLGWTYELDNLNTNLPIFGDITAAPDGGFYFVTTLVGSGERFGYVAKLSSDGQTEWENEYQFNSASSRFYGLNVAANGDVLVAGYNDSPPVSAVMRLDNTGDVIWDNSFDPGVAFSRFTSVQEAADGTIYAGGTAFETDFTNDKSNIYHIAADGTELGGGYLTGNENGGSLYDVLIDSEGTLYSLSLVTPSNGVNVINSNRRSRVIDFEQYDDDFNVIDQQLFGLGYAPIAYHMIQHSDGGFAIYGNGTKERTGGYLIRIDAEGISSTVEIQKQGVLNVQPTITSHQSTILLESEHQGNVLLTLFDNNGKAVKTIQGEKSAPIWKENIDLSDLPKGTYFARVDLAGFAWVKELIKL